MESSKSSKKILEKRTNVNFYVFGDIVSKYYFDLINNEREKCFLKEQIMFEGFKKDIPKLFDTIDITLHTTRVESFGRVLIESNASSVPVSLQCWCGS